ncbi:MAG TPA: DUF3795 domain-containing protein [Spirochaetia bacterium]|nr:DUF3795 domain-containing protein [Spirochaetia bacterium]
MAGLAFCGNVCTYCPRYIATTSGSMEGLKTVVELWYRCGWRDTVVSAMEIACHGCRSIQWCRYGISQCALERKVDNCGRCNDYPCVKLAQALEKSERFSSICNDVCSRTDYELLHRAFFTKKENLERVSQL